MTIEKQLIERIGRRMKLRDLHVLMIVQQAGSMGKAAVQLNTTQSAVSRSIADLEHAVGARLLDRSRRGIEPTPHGRALLKRGATIFDELRQGMSEIEYLSDPTAGEVRIAASEPMTAGVLPVILSRLSKKYPRVAIHVLQMPVGSLQFRTPPYRELRERAVDLVLGPIVKPFADDELEAEDLFGDHLTVTVGARNRWLRRRSVQLSDLMDDEWILPAADSPVGVRIAEAFRASGLAMPRRTLACISIQLQTEMLATQRFVTLFPRSLIRFRGDRFAIKALPIKMPSPPLRIGIVTLRNRSISPAAQLFIEMAREVTRPLARER